MKHREKHRSHRIGWLRAAVLGANDGIVSTASLILGVAASGATAQQIWIAGIAALVAGAMSMAAGEYVSVSSQADTEQADLKREQEELATDPEYEHAELTTIYIQRGLTPELASTVAKQLMQHDALAAHARDELGLIESNAARPLQAAFSSAGSFTVGAMLPLIIAILCPTAIVFWMVTISSLLFLMILGMLSATVGGASALIAAARVTFWGALAMGLTAAVGTIFGIVT